MVYTLEQVKQLVTDTAIKADWINFAFERRKYAVAVSFGTQLLEGINIIASQTFATTNSVTQFVLQVACTNSRFCINAISVIFTNQEATAIVASFTITTNIVISKDVVSAVVAFAIFKESTNGQTISVSFTNTNDATPTIYVNMATGFVFAMVAVNSCENFRIFFIFCPLLLLYYNIC